jgi:hypothetical protein
MRRRFDFFLIMQPAAYRATSAELVSKKTPYLQYRKSVPLNVTDVTE